MLKKVQKKLHRWLCVPPCFPVTISDQLQALTTSDSYVSLATRAGRFEGSAGMGRCVMLSLATKWLYDLRGVLVWEGVSSVLGTWHFLDKGFLCTVGHHA